MSHHDNGPDVAAQDGGVEVEKWILRTLLFGVVGAVLAAIAASVDDIQRYIRIKQM